MAATVLERELRPRTRASTRFWRWAFAAFVVVNLGVEVIGAQRDRQLTEVAVTVTGRPDLGIHCERWWDTLLNMSVHPGYVEWGSDTAQLSWSVCADALRWSDDPAGRDTRLGIMILTHELAHLVGHQSEAETECVAMWAVGRTALALGGSTADGSATANWYAANHNPLLRPDYHAPGCLTGGAPSSPIVGGR